MKSRTRENDQRFTRRESGNNIHKTMAILPEHTAINFIADTLFFDS